MGKVQKTSFMMVFLEREREMAFLHLYLFNFVYKRLEFKVITITSEYMKRCLVKLWTNNGRTSKIGTISEKPSGFPNDHSHIGASVKSWILWQCWRMTHDDTHIENES